MLGIFSRLTPALVDKGSSLLVKTQLKDEPAQPRRDSLWQAGHDGEVRGGQSGIRRSAYTAAALNPALSALLLGAGVAAAFAVWRKRRD